MSLTGNTTIDYGGLRFGARDAAGVVWKLTNLQGWGSPKSSVQVTPNVRQAGAWAGLGYMTERYLTVTLTVMASTPLLLNQALDMLHAAVSFEDQPFTVTQSGVTRSVTVRRAGTDIVENRVNTVLAQPTFQVVALDARKMYAQQSGATALPSTSGGITVPLTVPFTITSTIAQGVVQLTNQGNTAGPVTVRFDGPCGGPAVTHQSSGSVLELSSSLTLGAGEWLEVNMDAHTVLANGTASRSAWVTSRGWSAFEPGVNVWAFTASAYNPAALMTITAYPADL